MSPAIAQGRAGVRHVQGVRPNRAADFRICHFRRRLITCFVLVKTYTLQIYHGNILLMENKHSKCLLSGSLKKAQIYACQNTFGLAGLRPDLLGKLKRSQTT